MAWLLRYLRFLKPQINLRRPKSHEPFVLFHITAGAVSGSQEQVEQDEQDFPQEFTLFPTLPIELQLEIWKTALPPGEDVFEIKPNKPLPLSTQAFANFRKVAQENSHKIKCLSSYISKTDFIYDQANFNCLAPHVENILFQYSRFDFGLLEDNLDFWMRAIKGGFTRDVKRIKVLVHKFPKNYRFVLNRRHELLAKVPDGHEVVDWIQKEPKERLKRLDETTIDKFWTYEENGKSPELMLEMCSFCWRQDDSAAAAWVSCAEASAGGGASSSRSSSARSIFGL